MISRREFLQFAAAATTVRLKPDTTDITGIPQTAKTDVGSVRLQADRIARVRLSDQRNGKPRGSEFVFARLRYDSGDWDYNPKVAANVLDSVIQYTSIPVYKEEVVIAADSAELLS